MNPSKFAGALVVSVPLGVVLTLAYQFGASTFGDHPIYGVLWASFAATAAVCIFPAINGSTAAVRRVSWLVVTMCFTCSVIGGWVSLGSKYAQVLERETAARGITADLSAVRAQLLALPPHRDAQAVRSEQDIRQDAYDRQQAQARRMGRTWSPSADDVARDVALGNELATIRQAAEIRGRIADLERRAADTGGQKALAIVPWLARSTGASDGTIVQAMALVFILTAEVASMAGLYSVLGGHAPTPTGGQKLPEPERRREPDTPAEVPQSAPVDLPTPSNDVAAQIDADPVAAFLEQMVVPDASAVTAFADIEGAWMAWCRDNGIDGSAVNLGFALKRCGYDSVRMAGGRRMGRKGLSLRERQAA